MESSEGETQSFQVGKDARQIPAPSAPVEKHKESTKISAHATAEIEKILDNRLPQRNNFEALQEITENEADGDRVHC